MTMKQQITSPFVTQMKDHLDGMVYPAMPHETEQQAFQYAKQRSGERRADITVHNHDGKAIGVFVDGEKVIRE